MFSWGQARSTLTEVLVIHHRQAFAALSLPGATSALLSESLSVFIALAPVAYVGNIQAPFVRMLAGESDLHHSQTSHIRTCAKHVFQVL